MGRIPSWGTPLPMGIQGNSEMEFAYMDWVEGLESEPATQEQVELGYKNTEMLYCARDSKDASITVGMEAILRGPITEAQIKQIDRMMREQHLPYKNPNGKVVTVTVKIFRPELVGLPAFSIDGYIHDIGLGGDWNYWATDAEPTVDMSVEEFIKKYEEAVRV